MKKILSAILLLVILSAALVACNAPSEPHPEDPNKNKDFYAKYSEEEKQLYELLWKDTTLLSVQVDITPAELKKIDDAYAYFVKTGNTERLETFRKCNLTISVNGTDYYYEEVGIRMHGNTSRRSFCDDEGNLFNFVHFRFSLTETFDGSKYSKGAWGKDIAHDWQDKEQRSARKNRSFATLEKFVYKWNKNFDNTFMREVYCNKMFRAYGLVAPNITLCQMTVKQKDGFVNYGVGNFFETVDKHFLNRVFFGDQRGGDLYKCGWGSGPANLTPTSDKGVESYTKRFTYTLKTNDDKASPTYNGHKYLNKLLDTLKSWNKNGDRQVLESVVDMDYFTQFEAVNYMVGNPDCIRNNSNNYYLYFIPETGKVIFIPYDYDRCFGINVDWNPSGNSMTAVAPFGVSGAVGECSNPLYKKTVLDGGNDYYQQLYRQKLQKVLDDGWMNYGKFSLMMENYRTNYKDLTVPSLQILQKLGWEEERFVFADRGTTELGSSTDNISMMLYLQLKTQTVKKYI